MAGTSNGHTPIDPESILDLDAFAPVPTKSIRIGGKEYPVTSFFDLSSEAALKLLRIEEETTGKPIPEQFERMREQVRLIVAGLPEAVLKKMSWRQLVATTREAWLLSRGPQEAEAPPAEAATPAAAAAESATTSASAPSSPAAPVSTGGATGS